MTEPPKKMYGLVLKKKPIIGPGLDGLVKATGQKRPQGFESSSDEEEGGKKRGPSTSQIREKKQTMFEYEKALAEDPTVFQYDEVHDELVAKRNEKTESAKVADKKKEPKYMKNLLKAAERRNLAYQAVEERKQQKERIAEGGKFDDKEVFVTGAYKKQMEELEKYKEEEAKKEYLEARMAVTKQNDLSGFYRHFLNDLARDGTMKKDEEEEGEPTIKQEPVDNDAPDDISESKTNSTLESGEKSQQSSSNRSGKPPSRKSYRKRQDSSSDEEDRRTSRDAREDSRKRKPSPQRKKHGIYSSDSDSDSPPPPPPPKRAGLEILKKPGKERRMETKLEQQRRRFTPPPPSSDDAQRGTTMGERRRSPSPEPERRRKSSESPPRKSRRNLSHERSRRDSLEERPRVQEESKRVEFGLKKVSVEERLKKLKKLFKRKNYEDSIDAYRKRYFERKAAGLIVAPV